MTANQRRREILNLLKSDNQVVSSQVLTAKFGVSRQIIVQDIKAIRDMGEQIISTHRGYLLTTAAKAERVFKCKHGDEDIQKECVIVLENGGTIVDVYVEHRVYGRIREELNIATNTDVEDLVRCFAAGVSRPLMSLTSGYHYHTVTADSQEVLDKIEQSFKECGILAE